MISEKTVNTNNKSEYNVENRMKIIFWDTRRKQQKIDAWEKKIIIELYWFYAFT